VIVGQNWRIAPRLTHAHAEPRFQAPFRTRTGEMSAPDSCPGRHPTAFDPQSCLIPLQFNPGGCPEASGGKPSPRAKARARVFGLRRKEAPRRAEGRRLRAPGGEPGRGVRATDRRGKKHGLRARGGERGPTLWPGYYGGALKGTAAAERSAERPGGGASPGACAADQITPERPEERSPPAGVRARLAAGRWPSRTGKIKYKGSERARLAPYPLLPAFAR
jgi:hypothetical protein